MSKIVFLVKYNRRNRTKIKDTGISKSTIRKERIPKFNWMDEGYKSILHHNLKHYLPFLNQPFKAYNSRRSDKWTKEELSQIKRLVFLSTVER